MILSMFSLSQSSFTGRGQHLFFLLSYVINYYQNTLEKPECSMTKKKIPWSQSPWLQQGCQSPNTGGQKMMMEQSSFEMTQDAAK